VFLENRPVAAALAEKEYGVGQDYRNIVYITSGRGVGAGIISDGKIFRGSFGSSGEIGKMIMPSALDITTADTKDTLEYLTRKTNIIETAEKLKGRKISYEKILELFHAGDEAIEKLVRQNADYLAYAASVLANIINPEAIILGGRPVELGEKYLEYFNITFNKRLASTPLGQSHVILSRFGAFGVAFGGAVIVLHKVINLKA
jgi:predicted NBD/HSP70 family sugar kinase